MSAQGDRQASYRTIGGSASDYNSDALAAFEAEATIPSGTPINGAKILWLQERLGSTVKGLNSLLALFAESLGFTRWNAVGTIEAAGGGARTMPTFIGVGTLAAASTDTNDVAPSYPASIQLDDFLMLVCNGNDRGGATVIASTLTGWTHLAGAPTPFTAQGTRIFYRQATGAETGAISPGLDWGPGADTLNDGVMAQIYQFRNVGWDGGTPIDGSVASTTGNLTTLSMPSVTTSLANSLALSVCSGTDNSAFAAPTGETGGDWVDSGHAAVTSTSVDDFAQRVFIAQMAEAGTISGGSSAITPGGTPFTSLSTAIAFALKGKIT